MTRGELEAAGREVLGSLGLPERFLGFAMVAVDNEFWREQFAAVPTSQRLLLLPHCLRESSACEGTYDAVGLHCAGCGRCELPVLRDEAEALGYRVLMAEGTPAVVKHVLGGKVDAVLGVACLESLEKAFEHVMDLGIPHASVPLLCDGCVDTEGELDLVREELRRCSRPAAPSSSPGAKTQGYVPLLRSAVEIFDEATLARLLGPVADVSSARELSASFLETEEVALEWLGAGGKRFRPFITLAAYAAMRRGAEALEPGAELGGVFGDAVKRVALAIEVMHKASLVHDDIEDDDALRYGEETVHRRHGVPVAVNVGDYLIGLGYRLVASGAEDLGGECAAEVLGVLSEAHVKLCVGQGAELAERRRRPEEWQPEAMQAVYALKTAPAFEVAFYSGLRMAGEAGQYREALKAYSRQVGVAYQIRNDLEDYEGETSARTLARGGPGGLGGRGELGGQWARRPTILRSLATRALATRAAGEAAGGAGGAAERLRQAETDDEMTPQARLEAVARIYEELGVFESARRMVTGCRERALEHADGVGHDVLAQLMHFVVRTVL